MAERSSIEWCDGTVNFWWGCTKVGPGCDNCYAEDWNAFRGNGQWGPNAERLQIKGAPALLAKLQRSAPDFRAEHGRPLRIFMQSMSDTFDNEADDALRSSLFDYARHADALRIILLTKRISNVWKMVPFEWREGQWPQHIGLMATVVTQREADRDVPRLLELKRDLNIPWVGVSIEPMLEPISLVQVNAGSGSVLNAITGVFSATGSGHGARFDARRLTMRKSPRPLPDRLPGLDWVIVGGESGTNGRPIHPAWVRKLKIECGQQTAFLFKQWGEWAPDSDLPAATRATFTKRRYEKRELDRDPSPFAAMRLETMTMHKVGKKASGRTLDGVEYTAFPKALS